MISDNAIDVKMKYNRFSMERIENGFVISYGDRYDTDHKRLCLDLEMMIDVFQNLAREIAETKEK